jgi:hypothetical protein
MMEYTVQPGMEPTYDNQLAQARKMLAEDGREKLARHASVGSMCGCNNCFCCAARQVLREANRDAAGGACR